jgi:HK97 family phage portal protein
MDGYHEHLQARRHAQAAEEAKAAVTLLSRVKGLFGISFGGPGPQPYYEQQWLLGLPITSASGIQAPYAEHPTVAICISTIAEDAASVAWELYTPDDDENDDPVEGHPLLDLWEKPNELMSGTDLWTASYTYFKRDGECIWYYPGLTIGTTNGFRANRRNTGELFLLDPQTVIVERKNGTVTYKQRTQAGEDILLDGKYLTHFKRFNPYNPLRGLSLLDSLALELNLDWNAASWNRSFFGDQNGIPTGLIKPPLGVVHPQKERDDFLAQFQSRHAKKRGVGILPPGFEWEDVGSSPKDMEFGTQREFSREQILAVFGVPPFMAGVLDKANYANAREQRAIYWNGTITRMLSYFQGVINHDFMPKIGVTTLEAWPDFETVAALTEDLNEKMDIAGKMFAIGVPKRQINDRLELGIMVDDLEDADVGYLPFSMLPVSMVEEAHTPVAPVEQNDEEEEKPAEKGFYRPLTKAAEGRRANVWRSIASQTRDIEARLERAMRKHFHEIETEALAVMNSLKGWGLQRGIQKVDQSPLFDIQFAKGKLMRLTLPLHTAALDRGGTSVLSELDSAEAFDKLAPNVSSKLAELTQKIVRIDDTIEKQLRESLIEGIKAGESVSELSKRIADVMGVAKSRATTIARTETGNAFTYGRVEGMRQAGISKHEWLTARDQFVRDAHQPLDGEVRALDEAFSNGLRYPLDSSGPPEEVINCRCTVVPVVGEANAA